MVRLSTIYISLVFGIIVYSSSIQAKPHQASAPSLEDAIPFQCLLNIPMGSSPAEVKAILAGCRGVAITDGDGVNITSTIDISEYKGQVIYTLNVTKYTEGSFWLDFLTFSFFQGKLHSISGEKTLDVDLSKQILTEYEVKLGKSKVKKNLRGNMSGEVFHVKSNVWTLSNKSITLDPYDDDALQFIIQNDSISNIVNDILETYVDVEVYKYGGYDKKEKQSLSQWNVETNQIPNISTYCEGIGKINMKGKGTDLTFRITCENGKVAFEKSRVNIKGTTPILKKGEFPDSCEWKDYTDSNGTVYSSHYLVTVSKKGHILFTGSIHRDECLD